MKRMQTPRNLALIVALALPIWAQGTDKIAVSSHIGSATILSLTGVNSDRATVVFRRELDDIVETCVREGWPNASGQGESGSESDIAAACVIMAKKSFDPRVTKRIAYCSRLTFYTEFGNYSIIGHEVEPGSSGRHLYRTDWKDHETEKLIGNCGTCNTPQLIDTLRVLCPKSYTEIAKEGDLY